MAAPSHYTAFALGLCCVAMLARAGAPQRQGTATAPAPSTRPALLSTPPAVSVSTAAVPHAYGETSRAITEQLKKPLLRPQAPAAAPLPPRSAAAAAPAPAAANAAPRATMYRVSTRLYLTGEAAKRESSAGWSHLRRNETNLVAMLDYHDYHLLRREEHQVAANTSCTLPLRRTGHVSIMPLGTEAGRIRARIIWEVPNRDAWETQVVLTPNSRSLIGSPELPGGDVYLLSVVVR